MSKLQTNQEYTIGRAYPKVKARSSGWWDWFCVTSSGDRVGSSGIEKAKSKAQLAARAAAIEHNKNLPRSESRHIKVDVPYRGFMRL